MGAEASMLIESGLLHVFLKSEAIGAVEAVLCHQGDTQVQG